MPSSVDGLRVCIVGELTGGVGVYGQNLIRGLAALGVDPLVITPTPDRAPAGRPIGVRRYEGRARWIPQAMAFASALRHSRESFDIVHFTDARFGIFARGLRGNLIGTMNDYFYAITGWLSPSGTRGVYGDWALRHVYYNLVRVLESRSLRRFQRVLCVSDAVSRILRSRYGLEASSLLTVPYGVNFLHRPSSTQPNSGPVVLFAGGNFQRKGLHVLIQASVHILSVNPRVRFVVVGSSPDSSRMARLCAKLGVLAAFNFVGQVDHPTLYRHYAEADVFTMPSILEAFGLPYLEAMHCGVPVAASDVAGPDEFLSHGSNALLSPVGDANGLARDILRLLTEPELREVLVKKGRATAAEFTVERMARRTLEAYLQPAATLDASGH